MNERFYTVTARRRSKVDSSNYKFQVKATSTDDAIKQAGEQLGAIHKGRKQDWQILSAVPVTQLALF